MKKEIEGMRSQKILSYTLLLAALFTLANCSGRKKLITNNGIHAIKLGDQVPPRGTEELKGISLRDTLLEDNDYQWRAALMEYKKGLVYLEEDFFGSEDLNRIRIETPELHLKNGLRVGKTVGDLREVQPSWYISAYPDFGVFEFYSRKFPQIHFLVATEQVSLDAEVVEEYKIEAFGETDPIVGIVVF